MTAKDYHRFMDAPPEAGFTTNEVAAAYGVGRTAVSGWGLTRISKLGKFHIYRKSDVLKLHGEPPERPVRHKRKANGNGQHIPTLGERPLPPPEALRVLYPVDVRRIQEGLRKELECALAPVIQILDSHSEALARLVQIEERQLELWKPTPKAA